MSEELERVLAAARSVPTLDAHARVNGAGPNDDREAIEPDDFRTWAGDQQHDDQAAPPIGDNDAPDASPAGGGDYDATPAPPVLAGRQLQSGGAFILDQPEGVPAVWGHDDKVAWAQGEPLIICGPAGVGKTTLKQQLVLARIGLRADVLGFPVAQGKRVLYLAGDRPRQIQRSFRRMVTEADRAILDERLIVWPGPPPVDLAKNRDYLLELALNAGADTVFLDSLKDMAIGLSDDEVGAGLSQALQLLVAEGIEVSAAHHQRKSQGGTKPKTLEDVYGSTWITAGAGSVILLWGAPGDPLVDLVHLKQPAAPVGPLRILHDHDTGHSTIERGPADPLIVLRAATNGLTARDLARIDKDGNDPTDNDIQRARRQLERLTRSGLARRDETAFGGPGGSTPARYHHQTSGGTN